MPIRQAMRVPSVVPRARYVSGTARTIGGPDPIPGACRWLALPGLMVGVCLVAFLCAGLSRPTPEVPRTVGDAAVRLLRVPGPHASHQATVLRHHLFRPRDGLALEDGNLDDADPWAGIAVTAERLVSPSTPCGSHTGLTSAYPWPSRYFIRPQLLTRL
jgi:hypothetical protein